MLFDYLKAITCTKKEDVPLDDYVPYLITRWLSFGVTESVTALNNTVNSLGNMDKATHFKLLIKLFPKLPFQPKFTYIKKPKKKAEDNERVAMLAKNFEISQREIQLYLNQVDTLHTQQ